MTRNKTKMIGKSLPWNQMLKYIRVYVKQFLSPLYKGLISLLLFFLQSYYMCVQFY